MAKLTYLITIFILSATCFSYGQTSSEESLAMQYFRNSEYDKALTIYQKLFTRGRNDLTHYDPYLNTLLKLKNYDEAGELVKKVMQTHKDNFNFQVDFGRVLSERGQREKATDWYNSLIKNLPKDENLIRDLSVAFYRTESYEFAIKTLQHGRKLLNDATSFSFDLLALYRYQKNKEMLVQEYVSLLSQDADQQFVNQAKSAFSTLFETVEDYNLLRTALLRKLQKEPQNISLSEMLAWQYMQQKEFDLALKQVIALDKRLKEDGSRVYDLASVLVSNKAYEQAITGLDYLIGKGAANPYYVSAKIQILYTKNLQLTAGNLDNTSLVQLEKDYLALLQEFGKSRNTIFAMRQLAILQASYLNKPHPAEILLEEALKVPGLSLPILGEIKLELGDVYILTGEVWEAALIYGQVEKQFANEPIGQNAKYKNAKLSYYQGDFTWTKAQLDVLKSSTSQLIANDALNLSLLIAENTESAADSNALKKYAKADFFIAINQLDKALKTLDSIAVLYPQNSLQDDILMSKARVFQKQNNLDKAIEQLNLLVTNHATDLWGDDAVFMLAEIYESNLKNNTKAMEYYQKIITDFPGSLHVTEARKRYRNLRGDNLG